MNMSSQYKNIGIPVKQLTWLYRLRRLLRRIKATIKPVTNRVHRVVRRKRPETVQRPALWVNNSNTVSHQTQGSLKKPVTNSATRAKPKWIRPFNSPLVATSQTRNALHLASGSRRNQNSRWLAQLGDDELNAAATQLLHNMHLRPARNPKKINLQKNTRMFIAFVNTLNRDDPFSIAAMKKS